MTSVADYGSPIWWRGQAQFKKPLQALQNLGLRKILGAFKTAPIRPLEVEAALAPPSIRLNTNIRKYAFRALMLAPSHPVNLVLNLELEPLTPLITSKKPPKKTQLERIRESISGLVDYSTLEPI